MQEFINAISTWIIPVLFSITLHEAAHGYTANYLGDNTAKKLGRVTLNPFKHIDRFGLILTICKLPANPGIQPPDQDMYDARLTVGQELLQPRLGSLLVAASQSPLSPEE